jgi:RHS repeat-associated protein
VHAYKYDARNLMTDYDGPGASNGATYNYGASGLRVQKTVGGSTTTKYYHDASNVVAEYNGSDQLQRTYVTRGLDQNLSLTASGSTYYYLSDALGSIRQLLDADQATQNSYDYQAFGSVYGSPTENVFQPYRFTGREWDPESSLYYYRARNYAASLGRFLGRDRQDPRVCGALYLYVSNRPILFLDPSGLQIVQVGGAWAATLGQNTGGVAVSIGYVVDFTRPWSDNLVIIGTTSAGLEGSTLPATGADWHLVLWGGYDTGSRDDLWNESISFGATVEGWGGDVTFDQNGHPTGGTVRGGAGHGAAIGSTVNRTIFVMSIADVVRSAIDEGTRFVFNWLVGGQQGGSSVTIDPNNPNSPRPPDWAGEQADEYVAKKIGRPDLASEMRQQAQFLRSMGDYPGEMNSRYWYQAFPGWMWQWEDPRAEFQAAP